VLRLVLTGLVIAGVTAWQVVAIIRSPLPRLRAVEALALTLSWLVLSFATVYVEMSVHDAKQFSEVMNRTGALYFTVTTLATVGYGDITPRTDAARIVVMIQMVFNVAVIGASAKLILGAARRGAERTTPSDRP
jgi:voltage-gated potassium channel Kch